MSEALTTAVVIPPRHRFDYLPVGLFGSVMGLTGPSVAWRLAHSRYGTPDWVADAIGALAVLAFFAVLAGYVAKSISAPAAVAVAVAVAVAAEFRHPIAGNLFGTILISLLLLPIVLARSACRWPKPCGASARSACWRSRG